MDFYLNKKKSVNFSKQKKHIKYQSTFETLIKKENM